MTMSVGDCWELYKLEHLPLTASAPSTIARWNQLKWLADRDPEKITQSDVDAYRRHRKVKPGTLNRDLATLNAVIRYAWKSGRIGRVPFIQRLPSPPPRLRSLSRTEVSRLLEAASGEVWQARVFTMLALASGARTAAILDLRWENVDHDAKTVDFRDTSEHAARKKGRAVVPIGELMASALRIAQDRKIGPYVIHYDGKRASSTQRWMARIAKRAGIKNFSAHILRHTVASLLLQEGEDL